VFSDCVLVTDTGHEPLTDFPSQIFYN